MSSRDITPGRRIDSPFAADGGLINKWPEPGDYWYDAHAREQCWKGCTPDGSMANLQKHDVTENADGTITVSPSILVRDDGKEWHGYLECGNWREA